MTNATIAMSIFTKSPEELELIPREIAEIMK
jgi:hypothetical protein